MNRQECLQVVWGRGWKADPTLDGGWIVGPVKNDWVEEFGRGQSFEEAVLDAINAERLLWKA